MRTQTKLFFILIALWVCGMAQAQLAPPPTVLHSAESLGVVSDRIVVGHIESVQQQGAAAVAKLSITETIKGPAASQLELPAEELPKYGIEPVPSPKRRLLVHLAPRAPSTSQPAPAQPTPVSMIDLTQPDVSLYAADFTLIRGPAAIVRRVKEIAARPPRTQRLTEIGPPPDLQAQVGYVRLRVPVDSDFEAFIRARLRSPKVNDRGYALQSLPSSVVEGLLDDLRAMLRDPERVQTGAAETHMGFDVYSYPLRQSAAIHLGRWGHKPSRSQLEERVSRLATVPLIRILSFTFSRDGLEELSKAQELDELIIQGPELLPSDFDAIARIQPLRILRLRSVRFHNSGLSALARMPNLALVQFAGSTLDDDGLRRLEDLKNLRMLDLGDSSVSRGAIVRFLQMRPDVRLVPRRRHHPPQPLSGNPLHHAAIRNDAVLVRALVTPENVNSTDSDSRTALHYAAAANADQVIPLLLEAGADVNVRSSVGVTPLHWALEFDSVDAVKLLLAAKPNLNILRTDGGSVTLPDGRVARRGYTPLAGTLLDGLDSISSVLIEEGSDVNATDEAGWTPLMVAVTSSRPPSILELLIRRGARVTDKNLSGQSALDIARAMGNEAAVRFLTEHGG